MSRGRANGFLIRPSAAEDGRSRSIFSFVPVEDCSLALASWVSTAGAGWAVDSGLEPAVAGLSSGAAMILRVVWSAPCSDELWGLGSASRKTLKCCHKQGSTDRSGSGATSPGASCDRSQSAPPPRAHDPAAPRGPRSATRRNASLLISPPPIHTGYHIPRPRIRADMEDTIDDLNEIFASVAPDGLPQDVLAELQSILRLHSISPQELFYKWESYSLKMGAEETKLNLDTVRAFKRDVQETLERESRGKSHLRSTERRSGATATQRAAANTDVFGMHVPLDRLIACPHGMLTVPKAR